jgi:Mg/Co/Ni transporter MgtE
VQQPEASSSSRRSASRASPSPLDSEVLHGIRSVQTAVNVGQTLGAALDDLRSRAIDQPVVDVSVVDDDDRLLGQVPTRALLFSPPSTRVRDVMRSDLVTIPLDTRFGAALETFRRSKLLALPLVLTLAESVAMRSLTITVGEGTLDGEGALLGRALRRLRFEAATTLLLGLVCGVAVGVVGAIGGGGAAGGATMAAAVLGSMLAASVAGAVVPVVLHARRLDPQVAAGPIALVVSDVSATAIYFGLGLAILMPPA